MAEVEPGVQLHYVEVGSWPELSTPTSDDIQRQIRVSEAFGCWIATPAATIDQTPSSS
jgi:hypothetical protein